MNEEPDTGFGEPLPKKCNPCALFSEIKSCTSLSSQTIRETPLEQQKEMKASLLCSELVFGCLSNSHCLSSSLFRLSPVSAVITADTDQNWSNWTRASSAHHLKEENMKTKEVPVMLFLLDISSKLGISDSGAKGFSDIQFSVIV